MSELADIARHFVTAHDRGLPECALLADRLRQLLAQDARPPLASYQSAAPQAAVRRLRDALVDAEGLPWVLVPADAVQAVVEHVADLQARVTDLGQLLSKLRPCTCTGGDR